MGTNPPPSAEHPLRESRGRTKVTDRHRDRLEAHSCAPSPLCNTGVESPEAPRSLPEPRVPPHDPRAGRTPAATAALPPPTADTRQRFRFRPSPPPMGSETAARARTTANQERVRLRARARYGTPAKGAPPPRPASGKRRAQHAPRDLHNPGRLKSGENGTFLKGKPQKWQ